MHLSSIIITIITAIPDLSDTLRLMHQKLKFKCLINSHLTANVSNAFTRDLDRSSSLSSRMVQRQLIDVKI